MNIYEKIFDRLEELHMSQIELSRKTGIATSTIGDWRKKKINPQADKLVAICRALDMSLVDLLCDEEEEKIGQIDYMLDERYMIAATGDVIYIGSDLPKEYSGSKYINSINARGRSSKHECIFILAFKD